MLPQRRLAERGLQPQGTSRPRVLALAMVPGPRLSRPRQGGGRWREPRGVSSLPAETGSDRKGKRYEGEGFEV